MSNEMIVIAMAVGYSAALGIGIWLRSKTIAFLKKAKVAEGTVIGNEGHLTIDMRGGSSSPVIGFKTPDGKRHIFSSRLMVIRKKSLGKVVKVLYDPENPHEAVIQSWVELHMPWVIFMTVGGMGVIGLFITRFFLS
jgi:hypothetical protein